MLSRGEASTPSASTPSPSVAPDRARPRNNRRLGRSAPLIVITIGLLLLALANLQAARARGAVRLNLGAADAAGARIPGDLDRIDQPAAVADLSLLNRSAAEADRRSSGLSWAVAGRTAPNGRGLRRLRRQARNDSTLGAAAVPLRDSLQSLSTDPPAPDQLDALARDLSGFATAAIRTRSTTGRALTRAALAAGLLPTLAGSEEPRTWTVCRTRTGPCSSRTFQDGAPTRSGVRSSRPPTSPDLLIVGVPAAQIFGPPGTTTWPGLFELLYRLDPVSAGGPGVRSVVAVEQQAIDQLRRS